MAKWMKAALIAAVGMVLPQLSHAQGVADNINSLQGVLDQLYDEMLPLCSKLIGVGQGIAGFAATWYIASRVWRHIANAEPIDFYPLFRPFVIGFAVMIFPSVLGMINGVMKPTVTATASMVKDSDKAIAELLKQKEEAIKTSKAWQMYVGESGSGDKDKWYKYTHPNDPTGNDEGMFESIGNDIKFAMSKASYNFRNSIKEWMSEVLRVIFEAAALCINTLRTFQLIVLAILGPLVFGIAVFDGFQHTLTVWIARYINVFLWLPVANIFGAIIGKIQEKMLKVDIGQVQSTGDTFFSSTDVAYLVFLIIGIVGYFTVPSVANYIVNAGGGGAMVQKVTSLFSTSSRSVVNTMSSSAGVAADSEYTGNRGSIADNSEQIRKDVLWGNLMAGGAGAEYYFGYKTGETDLSCQDFRSRAKSFRYAKNALDFFRTYLPFTIMRPMDNVSRGWSLGKDSEVYVIYLKDGGSSTINLPFGNYTVQWYNPRTGGSLQNGSITKLSSGNVSIGFPPSDSSSDWTILIQRIKPADIPPTVTLVIY